MMRVIQGVDRLFSKIRLLNWLLTIVAVSLILYLVSILPQTIPTQLLSAENLFLAITAWSIMAVSLTCFSYRH